MNTDDGSGVWTYETSDITYASPSIANGTVVIGSLDQTLYALAASDGSKRWSVDLENAVGVSPAIADGAVFAQLTDGSVTVRSLADGSEQETAPSVAEDAFSGVLNNIIVFDDQVFSHKGGSLRKFTENIPPTASISIEPESAAVGEEVTFSAEASSDEDGTIESYNWELNGAQKFNQTGKVQTKMYSSAGTYDIYLRITDSDGGEGYAQDSITIEPGDKPPTASFTTTPSNPAPDQKVTLDAGSSTAENTITSYEWDVTGDGSYGQQGETLSASFEAGETEVTLRVTGENDLTDTSTQTVTATSVGQAPTARFDFTPESPTAGEEVSFDASESFASRAYTDITSYEWDMTGDGSYDQQGETTKASFEAGETEVTLRVTDQNYLTGKSTQTVSVGSTDSQPTATFSFAPASPEASEPVSFDASASADDGTVDSYEWDFDGDGTIEQNGAQPEYTFETSGEYQVKLRVSNGAGESTETKTVSVNRSNTPPTAAFTYTPSNPTTADNIEFDASPSTDDEGVAAYEWDFTGGEEVDATGQATTYNFDTATDHEVVLTVRDGDGVTRSTSQTVTVTESPFQQIKDAHISTAREVQDGTVGNLGVVAQAETANREYTQAVEDGAIDSNTALKALQRLNSGIATTASVVEQIGSAPELGERNERDLTRKMTKPTIDTAIQLTTMIATASSQSGGSSSLIGTVKRDLIQGIKSDAGDAVKNLIRMMLGDALTRFTSDFERSGETLVSEILSGALSTAREIRDRLDELKSQILEPVADALQLRAEGGFGFTPDPLLTTNLAAYAGSLDAGVQGLYTFLSVERVRENGLSGTTDKALDESYAQQQEIRAQAETAENVIDDAIEFGANSNLPSVLASFSDGISIMDLLRGVSTVVGYFISGIPTAFATGAGIGGLIEINIRHHLAIYNTIQGDSL